MMKAILMTATGGPEVLELADVEAPRLEGPHQIKVRLRAAGINPIDTKLRSRGVFYPDALPAILGCDGAGVVEETGPAVTRFRRGDQVWFCNGGLGGEPGNYAEYAVVDEQVARAMPRTLGFEQAAAGPLVLITAWEALFDRAGLQPGQRVLIHAGAGGVGHVAIQLARHLGASVATTVGSESSARFAEELGAEHVIRYHETDFVHAVHEWSGNAGADVVLDTVGGETFRRSIDATAHYGSLVTLLDPGTGVDWREARNRNLRVGFELMLTPMLRELQEARRHQGEILDACATLIDAGELHIAVQDAYPLADATAAHRRIEAGQMQGKLVLTQ